MNIYFNWVKAVKVVMMFEKKELGNKPIVKSTNTISKTGMYSIGFSKKNHLMGRDESSGVIKMDRKRIENTNNPRLPKRLAIPKLNPTSKDAENIAILIGKAASKGSPARLNCANIVPMERIGY
jgi:hypothetical protein